MLNPDILPAEANAPINVWPFDKGWESLEDGQVVKQRKWMLKRYTSLSFLGKEVKLVSH